uniref:Sec-independent translocase component C n=1 Tax=Acrochaetium secundatum TaxID=209631 RepID=A0A4D6BMK3_9FLOR|nr:Sec-independent translocase component C [Acrochaetium secundatum]QBX88448.1 Sec-independent translocase component C [Acrochaetium secundatum]
MTSEINQNTLENQDNDFTMPISGHLDELRERIILTFIVLGLSTTVCLFQIKSLTIFLQQPADGVKFLQLAPGEYFFVSLKIGLYSGVLLSCPFAIYQLIKFILPGLTKKESLLLIPSLISSIFLFFVGIIFGYYILAPAALNFFINYGSDIIEPLWSFEQYFDFILLLLFSTGLAFQIPILQIVIGLLDILSSDQMLSVWKYIIVLSTILGAILTPSTDPLTQLIMSVAILVLYFLGIIVLKFLKK